jgi:hypothetical protein
MYLDVELIKQILVEEGLDGTERTKKGFSCTMTATIETEEINKKNRDISSYYNSYKF